MESKPETASFQYKTELVEYQLEIANEKEMIYMKVTNEKNDLYGVEVYDSRYDFKSFQDKSPFFHFYNALDNIYETLVEICQAKKFKIEPEGGKKINFKIFVMVGIKECEILFVLPKNNINKDKPKDQINIILKMNERLLKENEENKGKFDKIQNELESMKDENKELNEKVDKLTENINKLSENINKLTENQNNILKFITNYLLIEKNIKYEEILNYDLSKFIINYADNQRSQILENSSEEEFIIKMLYKNRNRLKLKLLYSAKIHGKSISLFHQKCDGISPTIMMLKADKKTTIGYRMGGYISVPWNSSRGEVSDNNSFIFSIDLKEKYQINPGKRAIFCNSSYGPGFGGMEIGVYSSNDINNNWYGKRGYYQVPNDRQPKDDEKFQIEELEIYQIMQINYI